MGADRSVAGVAAIVRLSDHRWVKYGAGGPCRWSSLRPRTLHLGRSVLPADALGPQSARCARLDPGDLTPNRAVPRRHFLFAVPRALPTPDCSWGVVAGDVRPEACQRHDSFAG